VADPTPSPTCAYALTVTPDDFERDGGNGTLSIATTAGCKWAVKSDATWAVIEDVKEGDGPAQLKVYAQPNDGADPRRLMFTVADQSVAITQPGQGDCTYQVSPVIEFLPRVPWTDGISITTARGCRWTASSDAGWLRPGLTGGSGSTTLTLDADFNPATQYASKRDAVLAVRWMAPTAGQNVLVTQSGDCNATPYVATGGLPAGAVLEGRNLTVSGSGGRIHLSVLTEPYTGCAWSAESTDQWITWESPKLHELVGGDCDLYFTVAENKTGQQRRAVLTMDLRPLTIIQNPR
jgi:hypothetical protein